MSIRVGFWAGGVLAGAVLAAGVWVDPPDAMAGGDVAAAVFLAALLAVGLLGETIAQHRSGRPAAGPPRPGGARPADGRVELARVAEVHGEPNPLDPRFRRFVAIEGGEAPRRRVPPRLPPPLLGRVAILSMFLGRDGTGWSDAEVVKAHEALTKVGAWIEREAMRRQAPVNIELAETYFVAVDDRADAVEVEVEFVPEGDGEVPFEANARVKAVAAFSRAAARLGFADAADLTDRVGGRIEADARVWLLLPRCAGRSHAIRVDDDTLPGVALAVCYAREEDFPGPLTGPPFVDPVTVIHELMHLFGASDKYGVPLRSFPPRTVTDRDIMCLDHERLSRLRVDPLTAREIGWEG